MTKLHIENVKKAYGSNTVIPDVNLTIKEGEFVVFVGPSGCGKSTLLRMIAGLESITAGSISLNGKRLNDVHPSEREVAMVFQSYALYPHMTVAKNMGFPLKMAGVKNSEIKQQVEKIAEHLQITPFLDRLPGALSGGQRQRVAIGRAIVREPELFLFDEPLSNLDAKLRSEMRVYLKQLHQQLAATMIYVTHDQVEAMTLADRIVVLNKGRIEQIGSPEALYNEPANRFVASFIGSPVMNFLDVTQDNVFTSATRFIMPADARSLGIRPNQVKIDSQHCDARARVEVVETLGHARLYYCDLNGQRFVVESSLLFQVGEFIPVILSESTIHFFDQSGDRLRILSEVADAA